MNLEAIQEEWAKDSDIDLTDVGKESLKSPKLHAKYYRILSEERLRFKKMDADLTILKHLKFEYYSGTADEDTLRLHNWAPQSLRILKSDIPQYINADPEVIKETLKLALQQEKIDVLQSIIKEITNRQWQIRNYIEYVKFMNGA